MAIVNHAISNGNAGAESSGQSFLLALGAEGAEVKKWQEYLMSQGYGVSANGVFDKATQIATRTWQQNNGLERTGSVNADAYALAGLKVGVAADIDTSAGITEATNNADTTSPADAKEPEKTESADPTTTTTTTTPTTPTSETEKKEEQKVHHQSVDPNPDLDKTQTTAPEDPMQNIHHQSVDPNPELSENATYGGDYINADDPKTEDPAANLHHQVVDPNPDLGNGDPTTTTTKTESTTATNGAIAGAMAGAMAGAGTTTTPNTTPTEPTDPTTPTNGVASGAIAGAAAGAGTTAKPADTAIATPTGTAAGAASGAIAGASTSSAPDNNTPSNPPSEPTTDASSDTISYGKDYINGDAEPTTPTEPTEPTETPSDQNETDPNQYGGNTTDGSNGDHNASDNAPTIDEEMKAPPMSFTEFLEAETENPGTSEVTKANDKETAEVLAGLDQKANEGNNTHETESGSEATTEVSTGTTTGNTTEASTGATSSPANDGQAETPAVYGNTEEDYVPGTTMTWAEYFALQENANSANSNGSTNENTNENTNESGTTNEDTTSDTPVDINKLDPNQNEVDPNQHGGNTTDAGNGDPYASDNNPIREDSQYSDFVNEDTNEDTSTDKPTEDTKTESKEETSNADVLAGLAKIRDDGYKLAEETKKNAEAAAIGAYERAITEAETEREKSVIDARNAAAQRRADYGSNAEALANMGLKSSGYSAYLDQQSYETERAETQAANALADYNKRMAGYAKEDADRIAAENYAKSIYDIDTTYQTNLLAADDRASAKDRQTASDFRTILADVGSGAYTKEQALQLARDLGLSEEQIRAIEGAADEYTASVEEDKRAEQEAEDKEHQEIVNRITSEITSGTTAEEIEDLVDQGVISEEEGDQMIAQRDKMLNEELDGFIKGGDMASFEAAIDQAYMDGRISKDAYQNKYYEALTSGINSIHDDKGLETFLNNLSTMKEGGKLAERHVNEARKEIVKKLSKIVPSGAFKIEDRQDGLVVRSHIVLPNGNAYAVKGTKDIPRGDLSMILNVANGNNTQSYNFVTLNGHIYQYNVKRETWVEWIVDNPKVLIAALSNKPDVPHNSTTVLDREGNNDNKF